MRKKLKMTKTAKYISMAVLGAVAAFFVVQAVREGTVQKFRNESKVVYEYSNTSDINYVVNLKKNEIYTESQLEEDNYYLSKYVKDIVIKFNDNFKADKACEIDTNYEISATLRAYTMKMENKETIWEKKYLIQPAMQLKETAKEQAVQKNIKVDLVPYQAFIDHLREQDQLNMSTELIVAMEGSKKVATPQKSIEIPIQSAINIPMDEDYYKIEKQVPDQVGEQETETVVTKVPADTTVIIIDSILALVCLAVCIMIGLLAEDYSSLEKYQKRLAAILREYGSRIISIQGMDKSKLLNFYSLTSMDDLVKAADELEVPLMYQKCNEAVKKDIFYAVYGTTLYSYEMVRPQEQVKQFRSAKQKDAESLHHDMMKALMEEDTPLTSNEK